MIFSTLFKKLLKKIYIFGVKTMGKQQDKLNHENLTRIFNDKLVEMPEYNSAKVEHARDVTFNTEYKRSWTGLFHIVK